LQCHQIIPIQERHVFLAREPVVLEDRCSRRKPLGYQQSPPCSVWRLSDRRHLHCTGAAIRVSRISCRPGPQLRCARGSCAPRVCVRAAAVLMRLVRAPGVCVRAHTHTPAHRNACGRRTRSLRSGPALLLVPSAARCCPAERSPVPPATGVPLDLDSWICQPALDLDSWICQPFQKNKNIGDFKKTNFSVPTDSQRVCGDLMRNISATRGRPDTRFCVCGSPRGNLSHIASLTPCWSRSDFFRSIRRALKDHTCGAHSGGRTEKRLSENHQ
jgi:hypothetical protein